MSQVRCKFQVYAEILSTSQFSEEYDDAKAGHPLERRLNRLERVAAAYRGQIDLRFSSGMLVTFETADAALLGACEMQHRCAVLPQVAKHLLPLRIGIHQLLLRQRSKDDADNAREVASQLASLDNSIVASETVVAALNPDLRKLTKLLETLLNGLATYKIDWRGEIPPSAYGGESFWPSTMAPHLELPFLRLHYGLKTLELTPENPVITIGRDQSNDLVLPDTYVSRNHCRITRQADRIVLTDSSTNGTCIATDAGEELLTRKSSASLRGKGLLFFGRPFNGERRGGARFESY